MNKLLILPLSFLILLSACGGSSTTSENTSNTSESTLIDPEDIPAAEEPTIIFHYKRPDGNYTYWNMWIWAAGYDGASYAFSGETTYGKYLRVPLSTWEGSTNIGFIVRKSLPNDDWNSKDTSADRFVNLLEWTANDYGDYNIFLLSMNASVFVDTAGTIYNGIRSAVFASATKISVSTTGPAFLIEVLANDTVITTLDNIAINNRSDFYITVDFEIDFLVQYKVRVSFIENDPKPRVTGILMHRLFSTSTFTNAYNYEGELGALYTPESTTFRVWAPTSSEMALRLYENGTPEVVSALLGDDTHEQIEMSRSVQGTWETTVSGDLHNTYYTYVVTNATGTFEVVDPYAKAAGINGRRGLVVDFERLNPSGWDTVNEDDTFESNADAILYELHVRDLTMDDSWNGAEANRGKYAGMHESGTTYTASGKTVTTGFDHIKELGVNTVHILPMFDQNNDELSDDFNWGYNPLNYNVIEGQYSSDPYNGLVRIQEVKDMVKAYDEAGIKLVLDVVYNHLGDANGSNFNHLVPGYYFRYNLDGSLSNGSGVGNDTASERYMYSRFIADSVAFWAEEYKFAGFRFDLMGLHDTATMKAARDRVVAIDPDTIIYGEAWAMTTSLYSNVPLATQSNLSSSNMAGIGAFSDLIRDNIRGGVFDGSSKGWVQSTSPNSSYVSSLKRGFKGQLSTNNDPTRVVSYISAHDNLALYDKLLTSGVSEANAPKVNTQASAMMLFAQGIPFFHAGDELMRQKINADGSFNHNSYNAPDSVNSIKWENKVEHNDYFNKYVEMIQLRKEVETFRLRSAMEVSLQYSDLTEFGGYTFTNTTLAYRLNKAGSSTDAYDSYIVLHNGNGGSITFNAEGYDLLFASSGSPTLGPTTTLGANTTIVLGATIG